LYSSPVGLGMGNRKEDLPVTEEMSGRLLRLPMYAGMSESELEFVKENLISVFSGLV